MAPPLGVARLNEVDQYVAFCVHSNSIDVLGDDVDARGPLGYFGTPAVREARLIQLAWASAAPGEERAGTREQRYVAIPGVVDGGALGDVLLDFMDTLIHTSPRISLVTYNMELNAGIVLAEMERAKLCKAYRMFERLVRCRGFDLADPYTYAWLIDGTPAFPQLDDVVKWSVQPWPGGVPQPLTGEDEAAIYIQLTDKIRAHGLSNCLMFGHDPVRVWKRCCPRDNGEYEYECERCGMSLD